MADVVNHLMLVSLMCLLLSVGLRTAFGGCSPSPSSTTSYYAAS